MQEITITLPTQTWRGIKTKYPPDMVQVSPDNFIAGSQNFDTDVDGVITKRTGGIVYDAPSGSPAKDSYEALFTDGTHQLLRVDSGNLRYSSGNGVFNSVVNGAGFSSVGNFEFSIYQNRVYFDNGIDLPQVYDKNASYGGVAYLVPQARASGAQPPASAPVAALVATSTTPQVPAGGHTYKVTFLYYGNAESNGGPSSNLVTNDASHTANTVSLAIGGYGVTARKIYRDNGDGLWLLVGQVSNNTATTFTDTATIGTAAIPLANGLPPTYSLNVVNLDRLWVAGVPGSPYTLFFSVAGTPDIFDPSLGFVVCNSGDPITGLVVYNNRVLVFNRNSVGQILGNTTATFQYSQLPGKRVGCVDNRSIQIRTINGVPTVMWLSDAGFYQFNGQSVDYVSDDIEDQVNFNIQQALQVKGRDAQGTQADWLAGTATPGIDLTDDPGVITLFPAQRTWQSQADWEGGSSLLNVATKDGSNTLKVPTLFAPAPTDGTFNGTIGTSDITLPVGPNFTGESYPETGKADFYSGAVNTRNSIKSLAQAFIPTYSGVVNQVSGIDLNSYMDVSGNVTITVSINADASGIPGAPIASQNFTLNGGNGADHPLGIPTATLNCSVTGGTRYWIVISIGAIVGGSNPVFAAMGYSAGPWSSEETALMFNFGSWSFFGPSPDSPAPQYLAATYTFTLTPMSESGQWTSPPLDTFSGSIGSGMSLTFNGSYPASTSSVTLVQGTNSDPALLTTTWTTTDTINNLNGTVSLTGGNYRWWQVVIQLITTDSRNVPTVILVIPLLEFSITGVWVSEVLDHTTDITALNSLTIDDSIPAGTSVLIEIATSADNITYTSFGPFGSAVVQRYSKIRLTLTAASDDSVTPVVTSLTLIWSLSSSLISSIIDTGNTPAGWELFQAVFAANSGTVSFFVRTAASTGALPGATFYPVTNGQFISAPVNEFIQWKVVLTITGDNAPVVDSVTVNWFISQTNSIRVASIFFNRSYYLAAAEFGNVTNNIVFKYDAENTWKVYRGVNISTFTYFFGSPYYSDALIAQFKQFSVGLTDAGTPIVMDVRVALKTGKRVPNDMDDKVKILKDINCIVQGTGAVFGFYFSVDGGNTWIQMKDPINGGMTFTTPNDGNRYVIRMVPIFDVGIPTPAGRQIFVRILESTAATAQVRSMKIRSWIRDKQKVNYNNA